MSTKAPSAAILSLQIYRLSGYLQFIRKMRSENRLLLGVIYNIKYFSHYLRRLCKFRISIFIYEKYRFNNPAPFTIAPDLNGGMQRQKSR